ncbi:SipW-dependent-type signal peptide-containing protein [Archaeoglobus sp.]
MKKSGVFAALVLGLMVVAATYAAWSETITVSGSVATGELDVAFTDYSVSDNDDDTGLTGTATTTVELQDTDDDDDYDTAVITVTQAYPGYHATVDLNVTNVGTIAAKVSGVNVAYDNTNYPGSSSALSVSTSGIAENEIIDTGETKTLRVTIDVTDDAQELDNYAFTVTIDFTQFNEPE